jgi:hypothetical protein
VSDRRFAFKFVLVIACVASPIRTMLPKKRRSRMDRDGTNKKLRRKRKEEK